jgi:hypothetical protein
MVNIKTLIAAALLSTVAAASFAQATAAPKAAKASTPAAVTAPADATTLPKTQNAKKHMGVKHKKAGTLDKAAATKPAASAAK